MKKNRQSKAQHRAPKAIPQLPDLDHAKAAVLNGLTWPDAQRGYGHAIDEFIDWYCSEPRLSFNKTVVLRYRLHLESPKPGSRNGQPSSRSGARMIQSGRAELIRFVIDAVESEPSLAAGRFSVRTLLHFASGAGCFEVVALLLQLGTDPNTQDRGLHRSLRPALVQSLSAFRL
jgi:Ankyrin repeats (many copies)